MRIRYLGPVERQSILQQWAGSGVFIEARQPRERGPLESVYEEYLEIPAVLNAVKDAETDGCDAVIIGCFADPGIDAAREVVSIPVVGIGETSLIVSAMLGTRFGVITPLRRLLPSTLRQIRTLRLDHKLAHIEPAEVSVMEIRKDHEKSLKAVLRAAKVCHDAGADSLALGCGSMSIYAECLQDEVGIPVVNGLRVAVRFAELLVDTKLTFSKRAYPLPTLMR